jgi:hypothetical protein
MNFKTVFVLLSLAAATATRADFLDSLKKAAITTITNATSITNVTSTNLPANLTQDQVVQALKEALNKGVSNAIAQLGHDGGFLTNASVKIPIPNTLTYVEKGLRSAKQDQYADDFIATMNHAAEQAIPEAASVFGDAVTGMSIDDAKAILTGSTNAATQYFEKKTRTALQQKFAPIVKDATDKAGVTSAYKTFMSKAGNYTGSVTSSLGSFGAIASKVAKVDSLDVDTYVNNKALDGLFKMIALEEAKIRANPSARTSELLQKVFGAVAK